MIGLPIYPNSIMDSNEEYQSLLENTDAHPLLKHFNIQKCFIEMPNHARLHTCEFTPKNLGVDLRTTLILSTLEEMVHDMKMTFKPCVTMPSQKALPS